MTRLPLVLALSALLAGCATAPPTPPANATTTTTPAMAAPMAVTVTVGDGPTATVPPMLYTIEPAKLELKVNMPYDLTLKNAGRGPHDLVIDKLGVKVNSTAAGASKTVTFTPTQTGTFDMYCTIGTPPADHRSNGMAGKVVVS